MKVLIFVVTLMEAFVMLLACRSHTWKGHNVLCCPNGTAFGKAPNQIWAEQIPLFCASEDVLAKEQMNAWQIIGVLITMAATAAGCFLSQKMSASPRRRVKNLTRRDSFLVSAFPVVS